MKIFRHGDHPLLPADSRTFVGQVAATLLASADEGEAVHVYRVEFEPGGRTNWHRHTGPQWLLVVEGRVRIQREGEAVQDVEAGDAVVFAPGERHWHGAHPDARGVHLAVNVNATTEWLEPVTDVEYRN